MHVVAAYGQCGARLDGIAHGRCNFRQHTGPVCNDEAQIAFAHAVAGRRTARSGQAGDGHGEGGARLPTRDINQISNNSRGGWPLTRAAPLQEETADKIALGHHRDDILQTFFLNMFFGGKLKGMPPKLQSDDGRHLVIRPLAYVAEKDIVRWAEHRAFPIIPCTLCGSQENLQRKQVGDMLRAWDKQYPGRLDNMANALQHIVPSHLMDRAAFGFASLMADGTPIPEGDLAFDTPPLPSSFPLPLTVA